MVADDVFGRGYIVPIHDSLENIKDRLAADSVFIPTALDIIGCKLSIPHPLQAIALVMDSPSGMSAGNSSALHSDGMSNDGKDTQPEYSGTPTPLYRVLDSGYSSMNPTPGQSPQPSGTAFRPKDASNGSDLNIIIIERRDPHRDRARRERGPRYLDRGSQE